MSPTDPEDWPERIEYEVNAQLGGDATVSQIVEIMQRLGWRPPECRHDWRPVTAPNGDQGWQCQICRLTRISPPAGSAASVA